MQNYNYVPYTAVVSNVKESWSQEHYVEQHSRAELQLRIIYSSCVQRKMELVTRTLRRAALTRRTTTTCHIHQLCPLENGVGHKRHYVEQHSRAELQLRIIYSSSCVQWTIVMVKGSWSQGHYVEQHSGAELQLRTIYNSCVR